jgi:DNA-binding LytR/AlgR family response regulator
VARDSVVRVERDGRALQIALQNGVHVPVARQYAAAVRERLCGRADAA